MIIEDNLVAAHKALAAIKADPALSDLANVMALTPEDVSTSVSDMMSRIRGALVAIAHAKAVAAVDASLK